MVNEKNRFVCTMIDPMGPIRWLDNNRIIGRQNFGERNNLVIIEFVNGSEVGVCISVGFNSAINEIEVFNSGGSVKVTSNCDEKINILDLAAREIVSSCDYGEFSVRRLLGGLAVTSLDESPDGSKFIKRVMMVNPLEMHLEIVEK